MSRTSYVQPPQSKPAALTGTTLRAGGNAIFTSPPASPTITSVSISPASASLNAGGTQTFTASVAGTGSFSSSVTWSCVYGTITSAGSYRASGASVGDTVTATSVQDGTKKGVATITVAFAYTVISTGTLSIKAAGTATCGLGGASSKLLPTIKAAGTGVVGIKGTSTGTLSITGTGHANRGAKGTSTGLLALSGAAAGNSGAGAGPVISNVTATNITDTSVTISWNLNEYGTGQVHYGTTPSYGQLSTPENSLTWNYHIQNISGLSPGTLYHFACDSNDRVNFTGNNTLSGDYQFTTTGGASTVTSVTVNPSSASIPINQSQVFTATVNGTGSPSQSVTWSTNNGSINNGGVYTAPGSTGSATVTATSVQDGTKTGTSSVTITTAPSGTSVKSSPYNAKGDGVTDDTEAINACIAAVAGTGGTVVVPAGTYMVNPNANSWYGIGMQSNMTLYLSAGAVIQAITNNSPYYAIIGFANCSNCTLTGPGIVSGDRATHGGSVDEQGHGVYVNVGTHDVTISQVTSRDCYGDGFYIYSDYNPSHITITGVTADNNRRQGISIIGCLGGMTGSVANGCTITNSTFQNTNGTGPECGLDVEPNGSEIVDGVLIQNNIFQHNYGGGITVTGAPGSTTKNVTVDNNQIINNVWRSGWSGSRAGNDNNQCGIEIAQNYGTTSLSNGCKVTNNTITGNYGEGISTDASTYCTITGNTISGSLYSGQWEDGSGIIMVNTNYASITGNTITNNAGGGIWYQGDGAMPGNNTVVPNTFSGNGKADYPPKGYG